MKKLQSFAIDAVMVFLMYYGLYLGNEYAANVFWPVLWVFVFISVFIMFAFSNSEAKELLKKERKPRAKWEGKYSLLYDTAFSISLAALGFLWTAAIWWVVQWLANACVESVDAELRANKDA